MSIFTRILRSLSLELMDSLLIRKGVGLFSKNIGLSEHDLMVLNAEKLRYSS